MLNHLSDRSNIKIIELDLCGVLNTEMVFKNAKYMQKSSPLGMS